METKSHVVDKPNSLPENNVVPIKRHLPIQLPTQRIKPMTPGNMKIKAEIKTYTVQTQTDDVKVLLPEEFERLNANDMALKEKNEKKTDEYNNNVIYVRDDDEELVANKELNKTGNEKYRLKLSDKIYEELHERSENYKALMLIVNTYSKNQITIDELGEKVGVVVSSSKNRREVKNKIADTAYDLSLEKKTAEPETYPNIINHIQIQHDLDNLHHDIIEPTKEIIPSSNNENIIARSIQEMSLLKNIVQPGTSSNINNYHLKLQQDPPNMQQYSLQNNVPVYHHDNTESETNSNNLQPIKKVRSSLQSLNNDVLSKNDIDVLANVWPNNNTEPETLSNVNRMKVKHRLHKLPHDVNEERHRNRDEQEPNSYTPSNVEEPNYVFRPENNTLQNNMFNRASPNVQEKDKYKMKSHARYAVVNPHNKEQIIQRPHLENRDFQQHPYRPYLPNNSYVNRQQMYQFHQQQSSLQNPQQSPQLNPRLIPQPNLQQSPQLNQQQFLQRNPQQHLQLLQQMYEQQSRQQNHPNQQNASQFLQHPQPPHLQHQSPQPRPFPSPHYFH